MTNLRRSACRLIRRRPCWPARRRAWLRPRRRVSWRGIGAASGVVGPSRAAAAFCSAPRSAPSPWSAHAFTAAPASQQRSKTFSPLTALFTGHTAPELLYLETRWASLVSFGLTAGLLKDVLPVDTRTNAATIRNHLHKVALRQELSDERPGFAEVEGDPADGKELPVPEGPIVVGIDGAYLRNWHDKRKKFEVIVGKSVPEVRDHRYFGLVQTHDDKPERRLFEVLRSQDLRMNQGLTFLTDGGDSPASWTGSRPVPRIISTGSVRPEGCQGPYRPNSPQGSMLECPVREPCPPSAATRTCEGAIRRVKLRGQRP